MSVVIGAGYTGQRVLDLLPAESALGTRRSAGGDIGGQRLVTLDLDSAETRLPPIAAGFTLLYTIPPAQDTDDDPRLQRLLNLLDAPPGRLIYLSTSGVYGDCGGDIVAESTAPAPATSRARRRLAAERLLEGWCGDRQVELVILRVSGIYGPGRLGLERIRDGQPVVREADAGPANRIHVDDLVRCCLAAMDRTAPVGIYNIADGDLRSSTWFSTTVARHAGLPRPTEIPLGVAERTYSAGRLSFLRESRRLDVSRMRNVLEVEPQYADAEDGIRASLAADESA